MDFVLFKLKEMWKGDTSKRICSTNYCNMVNYESIISICGGHVFYKPYI